MKVSNAVLMAPAVAGMVILAACLVMWVMSAGMRGVLMAGGMTAGGCGIGGLLFIGLVAAAAVAVLQSRRKPFM